VCVCVCVCVCVRVWLRVSSLSRQLGWRKCGGEGSAVPVGEGLSVVSE
jgi:hypothetical protein